MQSLAIWQCHPREGDMVLLDNYLVMHGRCPFEGTRLHAVSWFKSQMLRTAENEYWGNHQWQHLILLLLSQALTIQKLQPNGDMSLAGRWNFPCWHEFLISGYADQLCKASCSEFHDSLSGRNFGPQGRTWCDGTCAWCTPSQPCVNQPEGKGKLTLCAGSLILHCSYLFILFKVSLASSGCLSLKPAWQRCFWEKRWRPERTVDIHN